MSKTWIKTETDLEAEKYAEDFWARHQEESQVGEFWAHRIKTLRGEPVKRLSLALENMPLPASFREAAIATRALIRDKKKQNANYEEDLTLLYWLAAIDSFSIPYSKVLREPGYNVIESIPGAKINNLPFTYKTLGYEKLKLLNKTDVKWLIESWGQPDNHTTLHEIHNDIWREYEAKLKEKRKRRDEEFSNGINKIIAIPEHLLGVGNKLMNCNKIKWATAILIIALLLVVVGS